MPVLPRHPDGIHACKGLRHTGRRRPRAQAASCMNVRRAPPARRACARGCARRRHGRPARRVECSGGAESRAPRRRRRAGLPNLHKAHAVPSPSPSLPTHLHSRPHPPGVPGGAEPRAGTKDARCGMQSANLLRKGHDGALVSYPHLAPLPSPPLHATPSSSTPSSSQGASNQPLPPLSSPSLKLTRCQPLPLGPIPDLFTAPSSRCGDSHSAPSQTSSPPLQADAVTATRPHPRPLHRPVKLMRWQPLASIPGLFTALSS
eukprot:359699-Chlamydomonas_euryale.AAC.3